MNAKSAIMMEMGDLFLDNPSVVTQDATKVKEQETSSVLVSADDDSYQGATVISEEEESEGETGIKREEYNDNMENNRHHGHDIIRVLADEFSSGNSERDDDDFGAGNTGDEDSEAHESIFDHIGASEDEDESTDINEDEDDEESEEGENPLLEGVDIKNMPDDQRRACIEAVSEAMRNKKMSNQAFDWGTDYIRKMYEEENEQMRQMVDSLDWNKIKQQWAEEDAEAEAQEQAERNKVIQGH